MNRRMIWCVLCAVAGAAPMALMAQERIYRCGNEYTNSPAIAKQRNCQVIEGGHVTVVHSGTTSVPSKSSGGEVKPGNTPPRAVQVDPDQQKARDNDAKAILQAELQKAQDKLAALKVEFNDGNPIKSALELRNTQVFEERLDSLKSNIARQESDVAGIQRELARHTGG